MVKIIKIIIRNDANDRNSDGDIEDQSPKGMLGVGLVTLSVEPPPVNSKLSKLSK